MSFSGKVALVTGGGSGIGRASAVAFAAQGAKVVVADIDVEGGEQTVKSIVEEGGEGLFVRTDVSINQDVEDLMARISSTYGRLDCAFNNAGIEGTMGNTVDCTEENWDRTININLKGVWLCMKHEIPLMLNAQRGAIVNCSSVAGRAGEAFLPAYAAAKHGVIGLTRTAGLEYAKLGIRVNAICPGIIDTPMVDRVSALIPGGPDVLKARIDVVQPIGRKGRPDEIAASVLFLCSDSASFITGTAVDVDGGFLCH